MLTPKELDIFQRAISMEAHMRGLNIKFEFVDERVQLAFPEELIMEIMTLPTLRGKKQDRALQKISPKTANTRRIRLLTH